MQVRARLSPRHRQGPGGPATGWRGRSAGARARVPPRCLGGEAPFPPRALLGVRYDRPAGRRHLLRSGRAVFRRWARAATKPYKALLFGDRFFVVRAAPMHVFVAGGAGYIGSVLVPLLLEHDHRVTVLDRLYFGSTLARAEARYGERLRVVRGDLRSFD